MDKINVIRNIFGDYKYLCVRPNVIPNNEKYADTANFVSWYLETYMNIPSINRDDVFTWTIYDDLKYAKKRMFEGYTFDIPFKILQEGDVLIFSVNQSFDTPDPNNYWAGIYIDGSTFLNFNSMEGLGTRSLFSYINTPSTDYLYCAIFRIRTLNPALDAPPFKAWLEDNLFMPNNPFNK